MPLLHGPTAEIVGEHDSIGDAKEWLVVSPYVVHPHLLNLSTITKPQQLLAKALTIMTPIRQDYATAPYQESFNWSEIVSTLQGLTDAFGILWNRTSFYIVVFRSRVLPSTDRSELGALDQRSHAEAMKSGGLLKYWFGIPDSNFRNLATCEQSLEWICKCGADLLRHLEYK